MFVCLGSVMAPIIIKLINVLIFRDIKLLNIPQSKVGILKNEVGTDSCGFGIYPGLHDIQKYATGISISLEFRSKDPH